jgi:hypothetical protein
MSPAQRSDLKAAIEGAFPPEIISATKAFADWGTSYPDAPDYRAQLDGRSWHQLDPAYFVLRADALGFLGTRELIAVLPIYLRSVIDDGAGAGSAGMLTLVLAKPGSDDGPNLGRKRFGAFVDALTDAQKTVIARVLAAFAEEYADSSPGERARATLDGYWRAHLPDAPVAADDEDLND